MPSDESLLEQAEEWKKKGNEAFSKSSVDEAIKAYSQGLVQVDRMIPAPVSLKTALLSNRAACYLKVMNLDPCVEDCTTAIDLLQSTSSEEPKLRSKLLFRRAKASFMKANLPITTATKMNELLQEAAKDLMALLSFDPKNKDASMLLQSIRAQHAMTKHSLTPLSKTLEAVKDLKDNETDRLHKLKIMGGLIDTDTSSASMELGRLDGVSYLLGLAKNSENSKEIRTVALNCLTCAGGHPPFVRTHLKDVQAQVANIVQTDDFSDVVVAGLAVLVKCLLHLDRDKEDQPVVEKSSVNEEAILDACIDILSKTQNSETDVAVRGVMENISMMMCGNDRTLVLRTALAGGDVTNTGVLDGIPAPVSKMEINQMTPKELATHRKRQRDIRLRDEKWSRQRSKKFIDKGGLQAFLKCASTVQDHFLRREMTAVIGKTLSALNNEEEEGFDYARVKKLVKPLLMDQRDKIDDNEMCTIEEVYNDDEEAKVLEEEDDTVTLQSMMERAELTTALLLSMKEVGAWAICTAWMDSDKELQKMVDSDDDRALALASEVLSAASSVAESRNMVTMLLDNGSMEKLLMHDDRDIRSGAAAAVAKLGLAGKQKDKADEGDVMGMLQAAADLVEDESGQFESTQTNKDAVANLSQSFGTTSLERGVEMVTYLISQTQVKEEISGGFKANVDSKYTTLQCLVKIAEMPKAGESLSGFGLATIFQHMAVTPMTIKKEYFQDKELSSDDYDQLQSMAKTPEEKAKFEQLKEDDTEELCAERIRMMANANVPRALVQLMGGASEHTLEQIILALTRMASEPSVRGNMIQQGALTACIKFDQDANPSAAMKKIIRSARHCIAKMLITMNPSLLTSAQAMGSIKPLIQLIRDVETIDLPRFEALLALTNIGASGDDKQNKIVAEKGIPTLHFSMFSEHDLIRKAATEAMCNLVGNSTFMEFLANPENLRLWLAFSADYDENYECARAAAGCLAMATHDPAVATALVQLPNFQKYVDELLQCGSLELMHRVMAVLLNCVSQGGECKQKIIEHGFAAFCLQYVGMYHDGRAMEELGFPEEEKHMMPATVDLAKKVVAVSGI
ncbi:unc-45 homolog B [Seminavis robusta]|uniref:Protein unc-45 homolog B n=1 Tax=Seminavis robusta TaxID=568900 RepID=A0A9N8HBU3_9STRA|nr:unc-45 homolog B [Seminavis robusta]|eukprot:Sro352_g124260.1 unc-45 homolog B (1081) ;mRNA; f:39836-43078